MQLNAFIRKPTILSLTYYQCSNLCDTISTHVAGLLGRMPSMPGKEYSVVTISFDERDTPEDALHKKREVLKGAPAPIPEEGWSFLTGDAENIGRLTGAVGFMFQRDGDGEGEGDGGFRHPAALIVLSPKGKIIRYLYGTDYLPADVRMALSEASAGRIGPTIPKALLICYRYDPESGRYVLDILRVTGLMTLLSAGALMFYLVFRGHHT